MKYILTTDTHFGHERCVTYGRFVGFEDVILKNIAKAQGDIFLHLGDICFSKDEYWHERLMEATKQFKKRILIRGNHDNKSYSWYYDHGWDFVCEFMRLRFEGKELMLSHMPLLAEDTETTLYHKVHMNIHGHMHGGGKYSHRAIEGYDAGFHYDVAPDTHEYNVVDLSKIVR